MSLQAPFPYFGGKSTIASEVWKALGNPKHYIEPFFGSGAVLLSRSDYNPKTMLETICDKDGFVCNVWRALQFDPDEVAKWCDWPVNHADLTARKKRLVENESYLLDNLITDDTWFDAKLAAYWIWAASCWIGSGLTRPNAIPEISTKRKSIHKLSKRPHLSSMGGGTGINKLSQRPHKRSQISSHINDDVYNSNIYKWFRQLSERLRYVRVVCGDWTRVCGGNWQDRMGVCGIFFDPPYGVKDRCTKIYHHDSTEIAKDVMTWAKERGQKETYRIVIAGYEELLSEGWTKMGWKTNGGYSKIGNTNNQNRYKETLYFSPHCIDFKRPKQITFDFFDKQSVK